MCKLQSFAQRYAGFSKKETFMQIWRNINSIISLILLAVSVYAGPARNFATTYTQPDGTTFQARIKGDEWFKLRTTMDGCAITKSADGWWYYGIYDAEGKISSSGYKVGQTAPEEIKAASRNIPYRALSENANRHRAVMYENGRERLDAVRRQAAATKSSSGTMQNRGLALLVEFSDTKFTYRKSDFENLLNKEGYNGTGSAKDYYEDQFGEEYEFIFDVSDIITLEYPVKHYGGNEEDGGDIRPWNMIAEACKAADDKIDFSMYDQDGDGEVDNVYVFYAGKSESENDDQPDLIWPHQYYIYRGEGIELFCDGKRIDRYACSAEITGDRSLTGIGSFCHEYGHTFGLIDLYDTNYDEDGETMWSAGVWRVTSLMDGGNYNNNSATPPNFNCIEREMLGLSSPVMLEEGSSYTLNPIHLNGTYARLDTDTEGEYYLFECRSNEGWDKYIGGKGMLVYHIDKNATEQDNGTEVNKWELNTVNTDPNHQCADLIEADGRSDLITGWPDFQKSIATIFFPQDNATSLAPTGTPRLSFWSGAAAEVSVTGIKAEGDNISFSVISSVDVQALPLPVDISHEAFPDAAVIRFSSSDPTLEGDPVLEWRRSGTNDGFTKEVPVGYAPGKYLCKLTGLESGNTSYETRIRFESANSIGKSSKFSFMTKRRPPVLWPYIFMTGSRVTQEKGLELYVVNASKAAAIEWYYNDTDIDTGLDTRFFPDENGTLKAVISWEDGSRDIILKELEVIR